MKAVDLIKLIEEYFTTYSRMGNTTEVFVNPSRKELIDAIRVYDGVRFIADPNTKKVYIWSIDVLHQFMYDYTLKIPTEFKKLLKGDVIRELGKGIEVEINLVGDDINFMKSKDWSWVSNYIVRDVKKLIDDWV